jgi:hypothetical protein
MLSREEMGSHPFLSLSFPVNEINMPLLLFTKS